MFVDILDVLDILGRCAALGYLGYWIVELGCWGYLKIIFICGFKNKIFYAMFIIFLYLCLLFAEVFNSVNGGQSFLWSKFRK